TSVFKERRQWERILTVSILVGVLVSFYALATKGSSAQSGGTIGNISFLAAYLLFDIFFAIILFFTKQGWWKLLYISSLIVMFLPLFATPEFPRGFFGAFALGIFLLVLGYMVFSKNKLFKKLAPILFVSLVLIAIGITRTDLFKKTFMDVREFPGEARKLVWQMGFEAWKERPLLGWGLENFNVPFAKYFSPALPPTGDVWYDRVHNIVLDTLVNSGIVGLLSYLAVFGVAIFTLLKTALKIQERKNILFPLGMAVLLVVYFLQNFFVFDMISSYLVFFLSLAFISFLTAPEASEINPASDQPLNKSLSLIGSLVIIVSIFSIYYGNIQPAKVSRLIIKGLTTPLDQSIAAFQAAFAASPIALYEGAEQFSRRVGPVAYDKDQDRALTDKAFDLSIKELERAIKDSPDDFRLYLLLGRHYLDFYGQTQDEKKLGLAEQILLKATELSSKNQQGYWSLAQAYLFQSKSQKAYSALQKAIDLEPRYGQSHWYLAMAYKANGENDLARQKIVDAEKVFYSYNWKANLDDIKRVIEVYQSLQDDTKLLEVFPLALERDPKDAKLWAGLAVAQANTKHYEEARESAQKAISLKPDFVSQLEDFLKSLPPTP
ncbi:MAG: O-antigen ligase family protein, partial [bacterium]|nr:O-antigen ligase family protein [bacterium]